MEDNDEVECNDEVDETTDEQKESVLPGEEDSLFEDLKNDENEEKLSDAEVLFGNEVSEGYFSFDFMHLFDFWGWLREKISAWCILVR